MINLLGPTRFGGSIQATETTHCLALVDIDCTLTGEEKNPPSKTMSKNKSEGSNEDEDLEWDGKSSVEGVALVLSCWKALHGCTFPNND